LSSSISNISAPTCFRLYCRASNPGIPFAGPHPTTSDDDSSNVRPSATAILAAAMQTHRLRPQEQQTNVGTSVRIKAATGRRESGLPAGWPCHACATRVRSSSNRSVLVGRKSWLRLECGPAAQFDRRQLPPTCAGQRPTLAAATTPALQL
jgi:hypothetical protein